MDFLRRRGLPMLEIELFTKLTAQSTIAVLGVLGNMYTLLRLTRASALPRSTKTMMSSLSLALCLQITNSLLDYSNNLNNLNNLSNLSNLNNQEDYMWGLTVCDVWNTLNLYFPMLLTLHCFLCLLDRFLLLSRPDFHARRMTTRNIVMMLNLVYVLPLLVTVPPVVFELYPADGYFKWRTDKECKFKTNILFALLFPIFTFWIPVVLNALIIGKLFQTMEDQEKAMNVKRRAALQIQSITDQGVRLDNGWTGEELWRQQMLALTFWSAYWNVGLFWIPHHVWQVACKVTGAEWPRATNFMIWTGYFPSVAVPVLYLYYDVYNL